MRGSTRTLSLFATAGVLFVATAIFAAVLPSGQERRGTEVARAASPGATPRNPAAARELALRRQAAALVKQATATTARTHCPAPAWPDATLGITSPSPELRALLGVLRLPQVPGDEREARGPFGVLSEQGINVGAARRATQPGGRFVLVVPAEDVNVTPFPTSTCFDARAERIRTLGRNAGVTRRALALLATYRRVAALAPTGAREGILVYAVEGENGALAAATFSLSDVRNGEAWLDGTMRPGGREFVTVVPDGVDAVELVWPKRIDQPLYRPREYENTVRRRLTVRDNVVATLAPRPRVDARPSRVIWRAANGKILRVITPKDAPDIGAIVG